MHQRKKTETIQIYLIKKWPMDALCTNIRNALEKPVVMIGLMGAGKTKIGALLAKALGLPFIDADIEIEKAAGMTIAEMFETRGEPAFRDLERAVMARLLSGGMCVIATGGGAVMNAQTAALVWEKSLAVWLKADLDVLAERTGRSNKRPLLRNGDPREILGALMDKRYPVYALSHVVVDTDAAEPEVTLQRALDALAAHFDIKEQA